MLNLHTGFICHAGENLFEQRCIRPRCKITQRALAKQDTAAVFQLDLRLNLALNRLRDAQREPVQSLADFDLGGVLDEHEDIRETVARLEEFRVLIEAIQSLPKRCRQVMTLRRIYGLSQKEVAAQLGISEHTVEAQSTIGLDKCAEFFRARGHVSRRS